MVPHNGVVVQLPAGTFFCVTSSARRKGLCDQNVLHFGEAPSKKGRHPLRLGFHTPRRIGFDGAVRADGDRRRIGDFPLSVTAASHELHGLAERDAH
jgi:hypothetical protein